MSSTSYSGMTSTRLLTTCSLLAYYSPLTTYSSHCLLPTAYCLLPTAHCPLPTAYCLLPTAYCLLPTAYCPLPTAYCLLIRVSTAHLLGHVVEEAIRGEHDHVAALDGHPHLG